MEKAPKTPPKPRKATAKYLENKALHYLARFASSRANLHRVLMRAVLRSARLHGTDAEEGARHVDALLDRFVRSGLIDDAVYAAGRASSLRERGLAGRTIQLRLRQKGVAADIAEAALGDVDSRATGNAELAAAAAYARRRHLGPFRPAAQQAIHRDRDLAAMARAGFGYALARTVVEANSPESLDAMVADDG